MHWWGDALRFEGSQDVLEPGAQGTLQAARDQKSFEKEDGSKGWYVESGEIQFEGLADPHTLPLKSLQHTPPPPEILRKIGTGLALPLRGLDVEQVWAAHAVEQQSKLLEEFLGLEKVYTTPAQRQIVLDFHVFNLAHARSICLGTVQAAVFVAIMDRVISMMKASSPSKLVSADTCFAEFERRIIQHSVNAPPESMAIFSGSEVRLLVDFVKISLFKHFLLYRYTINFECQMRTLRFTMGVERPLKPPSLKDAKQRSKPHQDTQAGGGFAEQQEAGEGAVDEEEEIRRLVEERLRETEAKLQAKLEAREAAFKERLESQKASLAPTGKKK